MKLILAIVSNDDASSVSAALTKENYSVTRLATTGGFLRAGNTTMIVGTEDDKVDHCIEIIGNESKRRTEIVPSTASYDIGRYASFPVEVQVGGFSVHPLSSFSRSMRAVFSFGISSSMTSLSSVLRPIEIASPRSPSVCMSLPFTSSCLMLKQSWS